MFFIIILISIAILNINFFAENKPYSHDIDKKLSQYTLGNYRTDNGLPSNILNNIHQSKDGYIWITSYSGLIRFDGSIFTAFNKQNTDVFEMDSFSVFAEDENGRLLIGTYGKGVYTYKNGVFAKLGSEKFNEIIESILVDKNGDIWISTRASGLYIFKDGLYKKMFEGVEKFNDVVKTMLQTKDGKIYFGTGKDGVFSYQNDSLLPIYENNKLIGNTVNSMNYDKSGILWIGTTDGLYSYKEKKINEIRKLKGQYITKIIKDDLDNLWISAMFGIFRKTEHSKWDSLKIKSKVANFSDIIVDNEGTMWFTTYREGLFYLKDSKITNYSSADGIIGGINTALELKNNIFLIGTRAGYLYTVDNSGVKPFKTKTSLIDNYIMHIFKDSKDNLLISSTKGILKISPKNIETWLTDDIGLGKIFTRMVFEDSQKNLWIGTNRKGLIKLSTDNKYIVFDRLSGLGNNMIMSITEDKIGNILIGTAGAGLNIITKEGEIKILSSKNGFPSDTVFYSYIDKEGTIWLTTTEGLIRYKNNDFFTFSKDNGFPANTVFKVLEDSAGDFWITAQSSLIRISKKSLNKYVDDNSIQLDYKIYNKHSGIKEPEFSTVASVIEAKNKSLWFTTTNVLLKIEPDKLPINKIIPPVYIESMLIDKKKVNLNETIILEPHTNRITINYTALHYFAPEKIKFKYKLEGYENDWVEVGNIRSVSYTNLSFGHYTFRVIASNNDGFWNEKGAKLSFNIKPFWYETISFHVLAILFLLGFIFLVFKLRVKQLTKRQAELEYIVKERTADILNQKEKINEKNKKLSDYITELKVLRGIVPICASCKKIRDTSGQWNHIETYIEKHSEAQFSHGICKDCEEKLYGDQDWYKKRGKK